MKMKQILGHILQTKNMGLGHHALISPASRTFKIHSCCESLVASKDVLAIERYMQGVLSCIIYS
jgi:hypothetical protein